MKIQTCRLWRLVLALAIICSGSFGCGSKTKIISFSAPPNSWFSLTNSDYGFSASFPSEPKAIPFSYSPTNFNQLGLMAKPDKFASFAVWAMSLPVTNKFSKKQTDALLTLGTDMALNFGKSSSMGMYAITEPKLLREQPILLQTIQGRESDLEVINGKAFVRTRVYVVGTNVFTLIAMVSIDQTNRSDISMFLDSFQLRQ